MAQGLERRQGVEDNLRGAEVVNPVTRQIPSAIPAREVQAPVNNFTSRVAQSIGKFAGAALQQAQHKQQQKSMVDGQLEAMQGKSFEEVEMSGDKWKLEGYRGVVAQSMSATLLRAQEQEINTGAYEDDPDAYRARLVERVDSLTANIPDERTREMARENLMQQMPVLVDSHMKQHLGFKEQQNFDALSQSVDVLSRDTNNAQALISFANGTSEATQGLSQERRKEAVTDGVINAFRNGNPSAYAHLEKSGFLNTTNLTAQQIGQIESAKAQYHSRKSQEWSEEHFTTRRSIQEQMRNGEIDPARAVELMTENDAKFGRLTTYQDNGLTYAAAADGVEYNEGTRGLNIQAAGIQGDYGTQARLLTDAVQHQESRGNPNAVSPKGATGLMQLMPATAANPGYGLPNIHQIAAQMGEPGGSVQELMRNPRVNKRMGDMYLEKMLELNDGDVELALISYNAGFGRAQEFKAAGKNWDNIPDTNSQGKPTWKHESRDYVAKITGNIQDNRPDPEGARQMALDRVAQVREQAKIDVYEQTAPLLSDVENQYRMGKLTDDEYRQANRDIFSQYGRAVDMQFLQSENAIQQSVSLGVQRALETQTATQNQIDYATQVTPLEMGWEKTVADAEAGLIDPATVNQQLQANVQARAALQRQFGIEPTAAEGQARSAQIRQAADAIRAGNEASVQRAIRQRHASQGTAAALPADQQEALIADMDKQMAQDYANLKAQGPSQPGVLEQQLMTRRNTQLATMGIVDKTLQATMNVGLQQPALVDGRPNPAFVEVVQAYSELKAANPATADRYVSIENRAVLDSVMGRMGRQGNIQAAVKSYGEQYAMAERFPSSPDFAQQADVQRGIRRAAGKFLNDTSISVLSALRRPGNVTGPLQGYDRPLGFDPSHHREAVTSALEAEVQEVHRAAPWVRPEEVLQQAGERVSRRYAVIGNEFIDFGGDVYEQTFGNRAEEMRGNDQAINSALVEFIRSPQFREAHPDSYGVTASEVISSLTVGGMTGLTTSPSEVYGTLTRGYRPFNVYPVPDGNGGVNIALQYERSDGDLSEPVLLNMQDVGQHYMSTIRTRR